MLGLRPRLAADSHPVYASTMSERRPVIRASLVHEDLERLSMFGAAQAASVRAALPVEVLLALEQTPRAAFLPLEFDVHIVDAVAELLGVDALDRWARESMRASARGPLIRPIVEGARRVFGRTASRMVAHMLPRTFGHLYRHAGHFERRAASHDTMTFAYRDMPAMIRESPAYLQAIASSMTIALEVVDLDGRVIFDLREAEPLLIFDWSPARHRGVATELRPG